MRAARASGSGWPRRWSDRCRSSCRAGLRPRADKESRYQVEADLKDSKITELLPGWWKTAGRATRVTFTAIDRPQLMRFDDIVIEGPGTLVKGMIELDQNGEIALASFPSFALVRRRQGDAARRPCAGRDAESDHARRTVRRPRLHQVVDLASNLATRATRPRATSISTSSSRRSPATMSRRCAASNCACRAATATCASSA